MHSLKIYNLKFELRRIASFFLILSLGISNPAFIYAQETSTQSAQMPTSTPSATLDTDSPFNTLTLEQNSPPTAAVFRPQMYVASLTKTNFQAKEQVQIVVKNTDKANLQVTIEGGDTQPEITRNDVNGDTVFTLSPASNLKPGKYKVKVINTDTNEVISEQQFTWGVLAINTNKSIYLPGETAKIAMAVLDESGNMVCFANVKLDIVSPIGVTTSLSTDDGTIRINRECWMHSYTINPDYEASYTTNEIGRYATTLTATTPKGSYTTKDRFEVRTEVPFDVERDTATRIYPADKYPVRLKIKANEAFKGKIVESVPTAFQISPVDDKNVISYTQENTVTPNATDYGIPHLHVPFAGIYPVSQGFGQQIDDPQHRDAYKKSGLDGHDGVDFALPAGTPIAAVDGGKVILAQENWIYGTSVVIEHKWGRTYYGHLSKLEVAKGDAVISGQEIGLSGSTGLSTGPHLHFSLKPKEYDIYNLYFGKIDPAPYFGISTDDPVLSVASYTSASKAVVWNVDVEKGAEFTIGYQYKSPLKSPDFYTIGPLQFISSQNLVQQNAKFDVNENPFVLGTSTSSAVLIASTSGELSNSAQTPPSTDESVSSPSERVIFAEIRPWQLAIDAATTTIITTSYTDPCGANCYTIPSNWNSLNNSIEVVGPGGSGVTSTTLPGGGGGGGGYAKAVNQTFTPSSVESLTVGTPAVDTWFSSSSFLTGGAGVDATGRIGGGGGAGSGTASSVTNSGGQGGNGGNLAGAGGGGGGGAGAPNGSGGIGGSGSGTAGQLGGGGGGGNGSNQGTKAGTTATSINGGNGGNGDNGTGGGTGGAGAGGAGTAGTGGGGAGGAGTTSAGGAFNGGTGAVGVDMAGGSAGTGGGGGGGGGNTRTNGTGNNGGNGGQVTTNGGAGGGGGGDCTDAGCTEGTGRSGTNGFIVVTYTPAGPTLEQLMRHGQWFDGSASPAQSFTF